MFADSSSVKEKQCHAAAVHIDAHLS